MCSPGCSEFGLWITHITNMILQPLVILILLTQCFWTYSSEFLGTPKFENPRSSLMEEKLGQRDYYLISSFLYSYLVQSNYISELCWLLTHSWTLPHWGLGSKSPSQWGLQPPPLHPTLPSIFCTYNMYLVWIRWSLLHSLSGPERGVCDSTTCLQVGVLWYWWTAPVTTKICL